jgi:CheY-like chemotaxis protein
VRGKNAPAAEQQARRVLVVHWKAAEAQPLIDAIRSAGFMVDYETEANGPALSRAIRANPPDAVAIDLSRLPSHGREIGIWMRGLKATRHIPLVFANGAAEKLERLRRDLPDACYTTTAGIGKALKSACRKAPKDPIVPPPLMERYREKSAAQKLGITPASSAAIVDAPRNYAAIVGTLPEGAELVENPPSLHPVTLWFITDYEILLQSLPKMRAMAAQTRLWAIWRKGPEGRVSQNAIREAGIAAGLVDYKICSLDGQWSGICFARKKA